ncbi:hypothetical protein GCM10009689_17150 [Brevibacterium antiquum]|uniref:hypothetical protein n=1 Tax=Brevibacterium antiquum TaxID=234835 RepID=UPI0018DF5205|nr:hypothetical protein [Brevibacterium antiquum]
MSDEDDPIKGVISSIVSLDDDARTVAIEDYSRSARETYRQIAFHLCRTNNLPPNRHLDDLIQIVATRDYELILKAVEDPTIFDRINRWTGYLRNESRNAVKTYKDTTAGEAPMSGMTTLNRRRRLLASMRQSLATDGFENATDIEVVDATNEHLRKTQKNPEKSGLICSVDDFYLTVSPLEVVPDVSTSGDLDSVIHSTEGAFIVAKAIEEATTESETFGVVLDCYFGELFGDGATGQIPQTADVAEMTGLTSRDCSRLKRNGLTMMQRLMRDHYGITSEDWIAS